MKLYITFFLFLYCFSISAQCNGVYTEETSHTLDQALISHASDHTLFSNNGGPGFVLQKDDKNIPIVFAGGLWMGGKLENNELKVSRKTYSQTNSYVPGLLDDETGTTSNDNCDDWDLFFTVTRDEVNQHIADFLDDGIINDNTSDNVLYYPGLGNIHFIDKYGWELPNSNTGGLAKFHDRNANGVYEPLKGDYPAISGSSSTYFVGNDRHVNNINPVGMEMHITSSVNIDEPLLALSSKINIKAVYHGTEPIYDFYFGIWIDGDLGCSDDDFVGCLPDSNLVFIYGDHNINCLTDSFEEGESPILLIKYKSKGDKMSSFISNSRQGIGNTPSGTWTPETNQEIYNNLQGKWRDGLPITFGGIGYNIGSTDTTNFIFDHSENSSYGPWLECEESVNLRDILTLVSFGPYTIQPGQSTKLEFSVHLIEESGTHCPTESEILIIHDEINKVLLEAPEIELVSQNEIEIYPNPTNGTFSIKCEKDFNRIVISSISGKQIHEERPTLSNKISFTDIGLQNGVYLVHLYKGDFEIGIKKLVKY